MCYEKSGRKPGRQSNPRNPHNHYAEIHWLYMTHYNVAGNSPIATIETEYN